MPYATNSNYDEVFSDSRISWKAKGLWLGISNGVCTIRALADCSAEGVSSVRSGLRELRSVGYIYTFRNHAKGARFAPVSEPVARAAYVYVLEGSNGLYKIGQSAKPRLRFAILGGQPLLVCKTSQPNELEAVLHHQYRGKRHHAEWFALSETDIAEIRSTMTSEQA